MEKEPDNKKRQAEELESLQSIYATELKKGHDTSSYEISIPFSTKISGTFSFILPEGYPAHEPPKFTLTASCLTVQGLASLNQKLQEIWLENKEQTGIIFIWVEWMREHLLEFLNFKEPQEKESKIESEPSEPNNRKEKEKVKNPIAFVPNIISGDPVNERKSKFQAHLAEVHSIEEVELVVEELMKNKKIRNATHNMYAYRLDLPGKPMAEGREDDGENGGGDKILYILQVQSVANLVIVVTRWFGGVLLGPERFKLIQNVATSVLSSYLKQKEITQQNEGKQKLVRANEILSRIKWDPKFNPEEFIIGYKDRFEGIMEISFKEFEENAEIPVHRIFYFKQNGFIVWDREKRLDRISEQ